MTGYSCVFQAFDCDRIVLVSSSVGVLTVLESVIFSFHVNTNTTLMSEGDTPPEITILKSGYTRDSHVIDVSIRYSLMMALLVKRLEFRFGSIHQLMSITSHYH